MKWLAYRTSPIRDPRVSDQAHGIKAGFTPDRPVWSRFILPSLFADKVTLTTLKAGLPDDQAVRWESRGAGSYTLEQAKKAKRGTEVVLHLKKDEEELLNSWRLRSIITKYSDHVPLPIEMRELNDEGEVTAKWETVNKASALWARPKSEISGEEYTEFYKHVSHDFAEPLVWSTIALRAKQNIFHFYISRSRHLSTCLNPTPHTA